MFNRKKWGRDYLKKNKDWLIPYHRKWRWDLKIEVLSHYCKGELRCMCKGCNIKEPKFLTLDHINGGGKKDNKRIGTSTTFYLWLRRNKYPKNKVLQVLCFNCNCARSAFGICPHGEGR